MKTPMRIGLVVAPEFQTMIFAAMSAFEVANLTMQQSVYDIEAISERGGPVASSIGLAINTKPFGGRFDTLLVGGKVMISPTPPRIVRFLRGASKTARRIGSICTGTFALADAGLLDGRRATTHWLYVRQLQERFPKIRVEEDRIFIVDGPMWTSAGLTAGIDLALGMIEKDFGLETAKDVARKLVVYYRRSGGQSQHSVLLEMSPQTDRMQKVLDYMRKNLRGLLRIELLAEVANLSPRQFSRVFHAETGHSPARATENLRVEAARAMLEEGKQPIKVIAAEIGFGDAERMRRAFVRAYRQSPQVIRSNAQR